MLGTDHRHYLVEALRPPHGYELDDGIATTYSLDLTSLLTVPVHLALSGLDPKKLGTESPIALLEALRRTASRLDVYADAGHIALPSSQHLLYGLLEKVLIPARPNGGTLHAKLWVLRFVPEDGAGATRLRVVVLSRNITNDRSWDVSLVVEGDILGRYVAAQRELGELIAELPRFALRPVSDAARERAERLGDEVRRAQLDVPAGFESLRFHVLGTKGKPWLPEPSDRLVVVSPFVKDAALGALAETTSQAVALVSRPNELDQLSAETRALFDRVLTLNDQAEDEEGAEEAASSPTLRGLHAKLFIAKRGWATHLYLGSANATNAALLNSKSVEVMAELVGKTSKVQGIDGFLGEDGLGRVLVSHLPPEAPSEPDPEWARAEEALEAARQAMVCGKVQLRFMADGEGVRPELHTAEPLVLDGVARARAWLVTVPDASSADLLALAPASPVQLPPCAIASATSLVAVELATETPKLSIGFVLNLPAEGLPARRDDHVVRLVVDNRDRFLALLAALLSDQDDDAIFSGVELGAAEAGGSTARDLLGPGLLERLVRAKVRRPDRLVAIRDIVTALQATEEGRAVLPDEFLKVWAVLGEPS